MDDLLIASKEPKTIIYELEEVHKFKLKGSDEVSYHLGCDFFRDITGTKCVGPRKYIDRITMMHEDMFGCKPKANMSSPLESNDHPELDESPLLDDDGIAKYQSLIGALQWAISLGRFDIATAVMTMSSFRGAPRQGHLDRLRRIVGYLGKMKHGYIRIRTEKPDYSGSQGETYEWSRTTYAGAKEQVPKDAPKPKGKSVVTTSYVDANLFHDVTSGKSVTGILHYLNQTPVEWYSKKQATVETATYGSEFVTAKTTVQQVIGLRLTLRYLGVPLEGPSYIFGDNGSVVKSGSIPHSPLKKRHLALAYHFTREAIASGAIDFRWMDGNINPADILSKHWGYQAIWTQLQPIMFWMGDTAELFKPKSERPKIAEGSDKCSTTGDVQTSVEGHSTVETNGTG